MFNYETRSAYNIVNVMSMFRSVEKAKPMADVQPKIATLQRFYIEFARKDFRRAGIRISRSVERF